MTDNMHAPLPKSAPYVRGSDTSRAAAESIIPTLSKTEALVMAHIQSRGIAGATDDEIEVALGMRHQTASARRRGLVLKGQIEDSGKTRPTRSGRRATAWVAKVKGESL